MPAEDARLKPPALPRRADYAHFTTISTRWSDNDAYRHVNNIVYYGFFDTAVNQHLMLAGVLDVEAAPVVGLVVETQCRYHAPVSFPDRVSVGMRLTRIGTSSLRYELAVFRNDDDSAAAEGHFVHVYVDRATNRPVPIPPAVRDAVTPLWREPGAAGMTTPTDASMPVDRCPRCGGAFRCGANDAAPCACTELTLAPALLARLREEFEGCLCLGCLRELAREPQ